LTTTYSILLNPSAEATRSFSSFLFNEPHFLVHQPCTSQVTFALWHNRRKQIEAWLHLFVKEQQGYSPCRAPFGSVEFNPNLSVNHLDELVEAVRKYARQHSIRSVRITSYPDCYTEANAALLTYCLLHNGYNLAIQDLNFHIPISTRPFESIIRASERWHIRKCVRSGFSFAEEVQLDLPFIHAFIQASRFRKGFPMSSDLHSFEQMFSHFPGVYRIFTVRDTDKVIAVAVTVHINADILYTFYLADEVGYQSFSPTVLLLQGVYEVSQREGYRILDLGIATDRGVPNEGLIHFKRSLGGLPSLKPTFVTNF
jgi:hypothetical protein